MAPSQHAETMDTILALKRKIRRDKEAAAATAEPIQSATNRYNKLKMGANHVHAGSLPYPRGSTGYNQPIEHAGYTRNILARNPRRYNDHGDELEDSESDPEADADAQEENPYSGIRLEELLCPLKHPSELATHPSLSIPYRDTALADMVASTEEKLRQERINLWNAKALQRQLIGDESWMPLERVETADDWDLFEPKPKRLPQQTFGEAGRKRKREDDDDATAQPQQQNGMQHGPAVDAVAEGVQKEEETTNGKAAAGSVEEDSFKQPDEDISMQEAETVADTGKSNEGALTEQQPEQNGALPSPTSDTNPTANPVEDAAIADDEDKDQPSDTDPPPPTRRITRALAAEADDNNTTTNTASTPTSTTSPPLSPTLLTPDPVFLLPSHLLPPTNPTHRLTHLASSLHLPLDELLETRRLLTMYIQKQEESVRGYESVLAKLLKAKHMKTKVLEWSIAEGHVGEWSDGEDWIDAESWGCDYETQLRKGRGEDEGAGGGGGGAAVTTAVAVAAVGGGAGTRGAEERAAAAALTAHGGGGGEGELGGASGGGGTRGLGGGLAGGTAGEVNGVAGGGGNARVKGKGRRRRAAAAPAGFTAAAAAAAVIYET